jgi:hypothetical protein
MPDDEIARTIEFCAQAGLLYVIAATSSLQPSHRSSNRPAPGNANVLDGMELEDWQRCADRFNIMGAKAKAAGMRFAYHNHNIS